MRQIEHRRRTWALGRESGFWRGSPWPPLEEPSKIAAALSDSTDPAPVPEREKAHQKLMRAHGIRWEFERWRHVRFALTGDQAEATDHAGVTSDLRVRLDHRAQARIPVAAEADRRRAELRHPFSTKIGPAIVHVQAEAPARVRSLVDGAAHLVGEGDGVKGPKRERVIVLGAQAEAAVRYSLASGTHGLMGQPMAGPFFFAPSRRDDRCARLCEEPRDEQASHFGLISQPLILSSTLTANRTGGYLLTCPILLYLQSTHRASKRTRPY